MKRWRPILSRVFLAVALFAVVFLRWDDLISGRIVSLCESLTGRRVSIGSVESNRAKLYLRDVNFYNQDKQHVCVHADEISVDLDEKALRNRRLIMERCQVTGLQATLNEPAGCEQNTAAAPPRGEDWFHQILDKLNADTAELESTQVVQQLTEDWQQKIKTHRQNGDLVEPLHRESKHSEFHDPPNPLRSDRVASSVQHYIDSILLEIDRQREIVSAITVQVEQDGQTIETAIRRDVQRLKNRYDLEPINIEDLDEYLFAKQKSRLVQQLVNWIDWGQASAEQMEGEVSTKRLRGESVLSEQPTKPDFLCEEMTIDGVLNFTSHSCPFHAELTGLTAQPAKRDCPMKMTLHLPKQRTDAVFVIDQSQAVPRQEVTIVQQLDSEGQNVFGREGVFTATMTPVELTATTKVELCGNVWRGNITLEGRAKFALEFAQQFACDSISIDKAHEPKPVTVTVKLLGTTRNPKCELHTNLGQQFSSPIHGMLSRRLDQHRGELVAKIESNGRQMVARIQGSAEEIRQSASRKIQFAESKIASLKKRIANQDSLRTPLR